MLHVKRVRIAPGWEFPRSRDRTNLSPSAAKDLVTRSTALEGILQRKTIAIGWTPVFCRRAS